MSTMSPLVIPVVFKGKCIVEAVYSFDRAEVDIDIVAKIRYDSFAIVATRSLETKEVIILFNSTQCFAGHKVEHVDGIVCDGNSGALRMPADSRKLVVNMSGACPALTVDELDVAG